MTKKEKTKLNLILSSPAFKRGLVIAPPFSGRTYALLNKAVALAEDGQNVLLVNKVIDNYFTNLLRGILQEQDIHFIEAILGKNPHRFELNSTGSISVCNLDYTLDEKFDTILVDSCAANEFSKKGIPDGINPNLIIVTSAYDLIENYIKNPVNATLKTPLDFTYNLKGDTSSIKLSYIRRLRESSEVFDDEGYRTCYRAGDFTIEVFIRDPLLKELNPVYIKYLETLTSLDKVKFNSTDYLECYQCCNKGV